MGLLATDLKKLPDECKELRLNISYLHPDTDERIDEKFLFNMQEYDEETIYDTDNENIQRAIDKGFSELSYNLKHIIHLLQENRKK